MDKYINIEILKDPEFNTYQILSVVMRKLHQSLVELKCNQIGISFPKYKQEKLGNLMRLHANEQNLQALMATGWLNGLKDHLAVSDCLEIPKDSKFRTISRVQVKSNPERLRRRAQKRHGLSEEEARERIPDQIAKTTALPFVNVASASTKQKFPLFIQHGPIIHQSQQGEFSKYGLSSQATVPWF